MRQSSSTAGTSSPTRSRATGSAPVSRSGSGEHCHPVEIHEPTETIPFTTEEIAAWRNRRTNVGRSRIAADSSAPATAQAQRSPRVAFACSFRTAAAAGGRAGATAPAALWSESSRRYGHAARSRADEQASGERARRNEGLPVAISGLENTGPACAHRGRARGTEPRRGQGVARVSRHQGLDRGARTATAHAGGPGACRHRPLDHVGERLGRPIGDSRRTPMIVSINDERDGR